MANINTNGQITDLLLVENQVLNNAAVTLEEKFYSRLFAIYNDLYDGNYSIYNITDKELDAYLYGADGDVLMTGSGFYSNNPKIRQISFDGSDNFFANLKGSFNLKSISLTEIFSEFNNEYLFISGKINQNGSGNIKTQEVFSNDFIFTLQGNINIHSNGTLSGKYNSISLSDTANNSIAFTGSISASSWQEAVLNAPTVEDLLNTQYLFAGNDTFNVPDAGRVWHGYSGNDKMSGGALNDILYGDDGNDKLYGLDGDDSLNGGLGNDTLDGGNGDDALFGGEGNDQIKDLLGDNYINDTIGKATINTGDGNDFIETGDGNDKITAGNGDDYIIANNGNDIISAGNGNNLINAGSGNDKISCGNGNDLLIGGAGADKLTGGNGSDLFIFDNLAINGFDTISDFSNENDSLIFDGTIFTALAASLSPDNLVVGPKAKALDSNDYLIFDTKGNKLFYDADGNGAAAAIQIAKLVGVSNLDIGDLFVSV